MENASECYLFLLSTLRNENKIILNTCLIVFFLTAITISLAFNKNNSSDSSIIGTWISEEDTNWKMVFTSTTCKWYYQNVQTDEYTFVLSNTTPQCDETVSVAPQTEYLQITNIVDPNDKTCYEVFGISNQSLSIRMIGSGELLIFDRQ